MNTDEAVRAARRLLDSGAMADSWTRENGQLEAPLPVEHPRGSIHSWLVAVTHEDRLIGFFHLDLALAPLRYSAFPARPSKSSWLDPAVIRASVQPHLQPGETAGEPYLTFDRSPSRLAWAVPISSGRILLVAGESVFPASPEGGYT
jgi:hypothetical protein